MRVAGSLFADDGEALVAAAVAGLGVILLPEWLLDDELRAGRLQTILGDHRPRPESTPLVAVYPAQRHLPPKVRAFVDFLVERFANRRGPSMAPRASADIRARE